MVKSMSAVLVPLEEYLNTSYDPDREYVDGVVKERNAGEYPHSAVQSNFGYFLRQRYPRLRVLPEQRVRTSKSRTRIPDVIVVLERPKSRVIEAAPLICIEILSACDTMTDLMERLEEYAAMGVIHIWVADPSRRKAYTYRDQKLVEVTERLQAEDAGISLPLEEVFYDI